MKQMIAAVLLLLLLCGCGLRSEGTETSVEATDGSLQEQVSQEQPSGYVALTFDDGPTPRHTARLLDGLKERGAHATFFLVGYRLEGNEALVRRIKAEGHQIGNHSYDHVQLTALSTDEALADLVECALALCTLLGEGDYWVRPPYGSMGRGLPGRLDVPVVLWSVDPEDWACRDADAVTNHILSRVRDGDIVLLHDCYASTEDAALRTVDALRERGFQPVTVAQLAALRGKTPQSGTIYDRLP
jgi:peptidoglycan/xylan/chitin deacetylase (PgdA/CDA1 family)